MVISSLSYTYRAPRPHPLSFVALIVIKVVHLLYEISSNNNKIYYLRQNMLRGYFPLIKHRAVRCLTKMLLSCHSIGCFITQLQGLFRATENNITDSVLQGVLHPVYLCKIHVNSIFLSTPGSHKLSLPSCFHTKILYVIIFVCYLYHQFHHP